MLIVINIMLEQCFFLPKTWVCWWNWVCWGQYSMAECYLEIYYAFLKEMKKFFIWDNAFLDYILYFLQGYWRCTVKKPETSTTIAWRNPCHEGKDLLHGCVLVCVSMSPVSLHFVGVQGVEVSGVIYLNISSSWLRLIYVGLFGAECSTFWKL